MQFVVDANILFAAFIKDGLTAEILVDDFLVFYVPEFLFVEFIKHKSEILEKTKRTHEDFEFIFETIKSRIRVIPKEEYADMLIQAEKISPDPDDVPYFALALKLKIPIWSNDKRLKEQD